MTSSGRLNLLHRVARIVALIGAGGSLTLLLRHSERTPPLVLLGMMAWVVSPFLTFSWLLRASARWSQVSRMTLDCLTLLVTAATLIFYANPTLRPAGSANAFLFVMLPPLSWLLTAIALPLANWLGRMMASRD